MNKESLKLLLTERQLLTDELIHKLDDIDDTLVDISHSRDFTEYEKQKSLELQQNLLSFTIKLAKKDHRYLVPIKDLEKENIVFLYD